MKFSLIIILITLSLSIEDFPIEKGVMVLTDGTIEKAITKYEYLLVLFYHPSSELSKTFLPLFERTAATLKKDNVYSAKVDATKERDTVKFYRLVGYPSIKFFIKGEGIDYTMGRQEFELVRWVQMKIQPQTILLNTTLNVDKFLENEVCAIYYYSNDKELKDYEKVALMDDSLLYGVIKDPELIKKYSKPGTVVLYKEYDEKTNEITKFNTNSLLDFVNKYSLPKVMKLDYKAMELVFGKRKSSLIIFAKQTSKEWDTYNTTLLNIHEKVWKKVKLFLSDINDSTSSRVAQYLGVKESDFPRVLIAEVRKGPKKYVMSGDINEENILKFIDDWFYEKLTPYKKSQKEPKENDGPVQILVGNSFDREVLANDRDVMILFYAPWCGHCKKFMPVYEDIAKKLKKNNPMLVFAKIDSADNEVENIDIHSFPTIKFFPGNKKYQFPVTYNGDRTLEDIQDFISKNAYNKFTKYNPDDDKEKDEKNQDL